MSPEQVMAEAAAWVWVPDDARTVETPGFLLVAYPEHFSSPTVATRWSPGYADVDAVLDAARGLGRDEVFFFEVVDGPLEDALLARGAAALFETLSVLALDLAAGVPDLDLALVKGRVETSAPVLTRAGFTAYGEVRAYRLRA